MKLTNYIIWDRRIPLCAGILWNCLEECIQWVNCVLITTFLWHCTLQEHMVNSQRMTTMVVLHQMLAAITNYAISNTLFIYNNSLCAITNLPMMFLSFDLLWEYRFELVSLKAPCIVLVLSNRIFRWGVFDVVIGPSCCVRRYRLTNQSSRMLKLNMYR